MSGFPALPAMGGDPRQIAAVVNRINQGKINCTGSVTLTPGQATTTVTDARADAGSFIGLAAVTAGAAAELAAGTCYISGRARGSFTLAHANDAATDRTFVYAIIG